MQLHLKVILFKVRLGYTSVIRSELNHLNCNIYLSRHRLTVMLQQHNPPLVLFVQPGLLPQLVRSPTLAICFCFCHMSIGLCFCCIFTYCSLFCLFIFSRVWFCIEYRNTCCCGREKGNSNRGILVEDLMLTCVQCYFFHSLTLTSYLTHSLTETSFNCYYKKIWSILVFRNQISYSWL